MAMIDFFDRGHVMHLYAKGNLSTTNLKFFPHTNVFFLTPGGAIAPFVFFPISKHLGSGSVLVIQIWLKSAFKCASYHSFSGVGEHQKRTSDSWRCHGYTV